MAKKVSAINWFKKSSDENRAKNVMLAIIHQMDKKDPHYQEAEKYLANLQVKDLAAFMEKKDNFFLGTPEDYDCHYYEELAQKLLRFGGLYIEVETGR